MHGSKATAAHGSKATAARGSTLPKAIVAADAVRPNTIATSGAGEDRSSDGLATIVLWGVFAAFAALAVGGLWRWVSRAVAERVRGTARASEDVAGVSANGAVDGFAPSPVAPREPVIGYVTTASDEWSDSDEASAAAIEATCERSDWGLFEIVQDRQNGKTLDRPGLKYALEQIADGQARGLVVSDLQRLSRSPA